MPKRELDQLFVGTGPSHRHRLALSLQGKAWPSRHQPRRHDGRGSRQRLLRKDHAHLPCDAPASRYQQRGGWTTCVSAPYIESSVRNTVDSVFCPVVTLTHGLGRTWAGSDVGCKRTSAARTEISHVLRLLRPRVVVLLAWAQLVLLPGSVACASLPPLRLQRCCRCCPLRSCAHVRPALLRPKRFLDELETAQRQTTKTQAGRDRSAWC
jgi:hypothetical protein